MTVTDSGNKCGLTSNSINPVDLRDKMIKIDFEKQKKSAALMLMIKSLENQKFKLHKTNYVQY